MKALRKIKTLLQRKTETQDVESVISTSDEVSSTEPIKSNLTSLQEITPQGIEQIYWKVRPLKKQISKLTKITGQLKMRVYSAETNIKGWEAKAAKAAERDEKDEKLIMACLRQVEFAKESWRRESDNLKKYEPLLEQLREEKKKIDDIIWELEANMKFLQVRSEVASCRKKLYEDLSTEGIKNVVQNLEEIKSDIDNEEFLVDAYNELLNTDSYLDKNLQCLQDKKNTEEPIDYYQRMQELKGGTT